MKRLDVMIVRTAGSCSVMCEVMNNNHPVLHLSDPTGLIPQPETSVIRLVFDVFFFFVF